MSEPHTAQQTNRSFVALVTGASSGIGEATAHRLACIPNAAIVLVARREERLKRLAASLGEHTSILALDLLDQDAPQRIHAHLTERHGRLDLLVNNAGAAWRASFAEGGYQNVKRTMAINFDAQVRLTEALLPLLRASAPSAIVNVASTAGRVARAGSGAYSASKFALAGWSDSLWAEERAHGVHVGLVLPGFISTEGFPQAELTERALTRWIVSTPEKAAKAIFQAGVQRRPERYVPRPYAVAAALRVVAPTLVRRVLGGGAAQVMTTVTGADMAERANRQPLRSTPPTTTKGALDMSDATQIITGVDFVGVPTHDLPKAVEFYGTTLGLPRSVYMEERNYAEFETGNLTLSVINAEKMGLEHVPLRSGIALHVDHVQATRTMLEERGVKFTGDTFDTGVCHMALFDDLDGNLLILHHRYAPRPPRS